MECKWCIFLYTSKETYFLPPLYANSVSNGCTNRETDRVTKLVMKLSDYMELENSLQLYISPFLGLVLSQLNAVTSLYHISVRSVLILLSYLSLNLPNNFSSWDLPASMLYHLCFSSFVQYVLLVPFTHLTILTILGKEYELRNCPIRYFLQSTVIFSFPRSKFRDLYNTEDILNHTPPIFWNTNVTFLHHPHFYFWHALNPHIKLLQH